MPEDDFTTTPRAVGQRRSRAAVLTGATLLALVLGGAAAVWSARELGWLGWDRAPVVAQADGVSAIAATTSQPDASDLDATQAALAARLAELEQRITQLNLQADAASGNAARAEDLLVASAVRRAVERGAPLGFLEDQLKLRFGDTQPNAVNTLIEVSKSPVTLDAMTQSLATLGPSLTQLPRNSDVVTRIREELSSMFVIRSRSAPSPAPQRRLERAQMFLETARPEAAIAEVEKMPGHDAAREWLALAQRYVRAQRALDLIETAAILAPRSEIQNAMPKAVASPLLN